MTLTETRFPGYYIDKNTYNVYSNKTGIMKPLKQSIVKDTRKSNPKSYLQVGVKGCTLLHRLIADTFISNVDGLTVNHKDGNKSKNKLYNLEKSTHSKNIKHAYDNNYYTTRGGTGTAVVVKSKETGEEVEFPSLRQAENHTGVDRHRIKRIIEGKNINKTNWEFKFK